MLIYQNLLGIENTVTVSTTWQLFILQNYYIRSNNNNHAPWLTARNECVHLNRFSTWTTPAPSAQTLSAPTDIFHVANFADASRQTARMRNPTWLLDASPGVHGTVDYSPLSSRAFQLLRTVPSSWVLHSDRFESMQTLQNSWEMEYRKYIEDCCRMSPGSSDIHRLDHPVLHSSFHLLSIQKIQFVRHNSLWMRRHLCWIIDITRYRWSIGQMIPMASRSLRHCYQNCHVPHPLLIADYPTHSAIRSYHLTTHRSTLFLPTDSGGGSGFASVSSRADMIWKLVLLIAPLVYRLESSTFFNDVIDFSKIKKLTSNFSASGYWHQ